MNDEESSTGVATAPPLAPAVQGAERLAIAGLSLVQGSLASWAAWALPWTTLSLLGIVCGLLGGAHIVTCFAAVLGHRRLLSAWKVASLLGLSVLLLVSWQVFSGGAYLAALYGSLGEGLFAAMLAIWGLFVLLTLPTACWSLVRGRHAWPVLRRWPWAGAGAALVLAVGSCAVHQRSRLAEDPQLDDETALDDLRGVVAELQPRQMPGRGKHARAISKLGPIRCATAPGQPQVTLVSTFVDRKSKRGDYRSECVQANNLMDAVKQLHGLLHTRASRSAIKLDLITSISDPFTGPDWTAALALRPALDGLCVAERCWMPWQLVVQDAYVEHRPLDFIGDLKFGVDVGALSRRLTDDATATPPDQDQNPADTLANVEVASARRITTRSWTLTERGLTELSRMRPIFVEDSPQALAAAGAALQSHIIDAQLDDGKFRYLLHPFSGKAEKKNFNLARQAGTLLALCELGTNEEPVDSTIIKGLKLLESHEHANATSALAGLSRSKRPRVVALGDSALPLVSFVRCRQRVGPRFDDLVGRLAHLVLALQQPDGSFAPEYDLRQGQLVDGPEPLYAPGQAILALALLEQALAGGAVEGWPQLADIRNARLRGMRHVAAHHWPASLYSYFFIEENWHCLAASASLSLERVADYEDFCLDYMRFKSRLILDDDSDVDPMFVGGFGFGNVIPPHNTGAAGFAEAIAGAIAVKRARGDSIVDDQRRLASVLRFLLRQQWTEDNCFGCAEKSLGAISEHTHSPISRIDFAQHTWAALGHGQAALNL